MAIVPVTVEIRPTAPSERPIELVGSEWTGWEMAWSRRFAGFYAYHHAQQMVTRVYSDRIAVRNALERGEIETVEEAKKRHDIGASTPPTRRSRSATTPTPTSDPTT
jgi:hypothetical protein